MRSLLRAFAISALEVGRSYPTPLTSPQALVALIRKLHPVSCDAGLIRLGPPADGGYLVPDDLSGITACFSPGVSTVSGFEQDCASLGMRVFLADNSVDGPAVAHESFTFTKKHVGATSSERFMTLDEWVDASAVQPGSDLMLQIDIEGFEYEAFLGMSPRLAARFRIIVAEFHDLHLLWSEPFFRVVSSTFEKLLQSHACVHVHPNNCCGSQKRHGIEIPRVMEFTFLRRDRLTGFSGLRHSFPHPLDRDNTPNPTLPLPRCWYDTASSPRHAR